MILFDLRASLSSLFEGDRNFFYELNGTTKVYNMLRGFWNNSLTFTTAVFENQSLAFKSLQGSQNVFWYLTRVSSHHFPLSHPPPGFFSAVFPPPDSLIVTLLENRFCDKSYFGANLQFISVYVSPWAKTLPSSLRRFRKRRQNAMKIDDRPAADAASARFAQHIALGI